MVVRLNFSTYSTPHLKILEYCEWDSDLVFFFLSCSHLFLSIDASRDDGSLGRLVNDEHRRPNCKMKRIDVNGKPHLCLFALGDIQEGSEITYDYGDGDCTWRTQVCYTVHIIQNCSV